MLNIELKDNGLDSVLKGIRLDLLSILGRSSSKKKKDEIIYKALGTIDALRNMIEITEVDSGAIEDKSGINKGVK